MSYKSPSIEFFENETQSIPVNTTGAGFATVGFSTGGPVNKLMTFTSLADFEKTMGGPVENYELTHNMIYKAMNTGFGGTLYFMRIGEFAEDADGKASVGVSNYINGSGVDAFVGATYNNLPITKPWFIILDTDFTSSKPDIITATLNFTLNTSENIVRTYTMNKLDVALVEGGGSVGIYAVSIDKIVRDLNSYSRFSNIATAYATDASGKNGLRIVSKKIGSDQTFVFNSFVVDNATNYGVSNGALLVASTEGTSTGSYPTKGTFTFSIKAKYPGTYMNGVVVKCVHNVDSVFGTTTYTINVYKDSSGTNLLESFSNLTLANIADTINDETYGSSFITLEGYSFGGSSAFKAGSYVLGEGEILSDGTVREIMAEETVLGSNGVPKDEMNSSLDDEEKIIRMFADAISNKEFLNMDNVAFSVIATPDCGDQIVQDAGITLASGRGDAMYIVDVPYDYTALKKNGIQKAVDWSNGKLDRSVAITSSYAGIFYGWLTSTNAYGSNSLICPPSVFVVPKILEVDEKYGVYYAPAGSVRGVINASNYFYSPDSEDRELLCGYNNINPIIFSNTRGLMIFSQKTGLRENAPRNRIHVRRMLNDIKRKTYNALDVYRFEFNNPDIHSKASTTLDGILFPYKNAGALESYAVSVSGGEGSDLDVMNVYLDIVPYGLVERIRIYLSITEAGIVATE